MYCIKLLLAGLMAVSICMGAISGRVTDTSGTVGIFGALVQLEKGGQQVTTNEDGFFSIPVGTDAIIIQVGQSDVYKPLATIQKGILCVNIAEKSTVVISTCNLCGSVLSTVQMKMETGTHFLSLPHRETGTFLHKIKTDSREAVLLTTTIDGTITGSGIATDHYYKKMIYAQRRKVLAALKDIMVVTKSGYLPDRMIANSPDTAGIAIKLIKSAGTVTDADGNIYQTVKIGNQEWTAENLRTTKYQDGTDLPKDTSDSAWFRNHEPNYCFYNYTVNQDSIKRFGALYNWHMVNTMKLAPAGWHIPTDAEWDTLQVYLINNGYNADGTKTANVIAKSLATKTDWRIRQGINTIGNDISTNNASGFSAYAGGYRYMYGYFGLIGRDGFWWSSSQIDKIYPLCRYLNEDSIGLVRTLTFSKNCGFSVRLVKD